MTQNNLGFPAQNQEILEEFKIFLEDFSRNNSKRYIHKKSNGSQTSLSNIICSEAMKYSLNGFPNNL